MPKIAATLENSHQVEVYVAGPGDVKRMFICTGYALGTVGAGGGSLKVESTFAFHVGPALKTAQFRRAIATASLAGIDVGGWDVKETCSLIVQSADADWDDEEELVVVRVEVTAMGGPTDWTAITRLAYEVVVLSTA